MLSDSYLPMVRKLDKHQHWMLFAAKFSASENDLERAYIVLCTMYAVSMSFSDAENFPPLQMQAVMPQPGPEPPLFGHLVSANALVQWLGR